MERRAIVALLCKMAGYNAQRGGKSAELYDRTREGTSLQFENNNEETRERAREEKEKKEEEKRR